MCKPITPADYLFRHSRVIKESDEHVSRVYRAILRKTITSCVPRALSLKEVQEATAKEFGVLCCLTTPGLRKDIRRQIRQLYSHKVTYYVHYNYILSSHLLSHSRFYFYY